MFAAGCLEPGQRNRTPSVRRPQPAATPNTKMNAIPVTWSVVVPLLQAWSTPITQATNIKMAITANDFNSMCTSQTESLHTQHVSFRNLSK